MSSLLAFLQILQILGSWTWAVINHFYIVSGIIIALNIIDRLGDNLFRTPGFWEIFAFSYLAVWYHLKFRKQENEEPLSSINIENRNTIQIINNNDNLKPQEED